MPLVMDSQGTVKFSCTTCEGNQYPCLRCSVEKSVFDLGYRDGRLKNPKEATGFDQKHTGLYITAYLKGEKDRVKLSM